MKDHLLHSSKIIYEIAIFLGHELIGAGGCRGSGWDKGSWPVTAGKQSRDSCSALCQAQEGCTAFSLSKSEDCFLFGHDNVAAVKSLGGECYRIIKGNNKSLVNQSFANLAAMQGLRYLRHIYNFLPEFPNIVH